MPDHNRKIDLTVRVDLRESEGNALPDDLPEVGVHAFDETGDFLATATFEPDDGAVMEAKLKLPAAILNRTVRLALGAPSADIYDDVPKWMRGLLATDAGVPPASAADERPAPTMGRRPTSLPTLIRHGAREKRLRVTEATSVYEANLYARDWLEWLKCRCEVQGRLIRRVPLPDGTSKEVGVCHACVLIYEVDSLPKLIAKLPEHDILRLRDDLLKLKHIFELPPDKLPDLVKPPVPPRPPLPFDIGGMERDSDIDATIGYASINPQPEPPGAFARMDMASGRAIRSRMGLNELGPQPEPPDMPARMSRVSGRATIGAEFEAMLKAGPVVTLRNTLVAQADILVPYLCYIPWLHHWYSKDLIRCVCTDEDGRFSTTIWYTCSGDKPDLYFKAVQCIGGSLHVLHDLGVACHTYWNYACGTEVVLETTDPAARVCAPADPVQPPPGTTPWIMPYGIGGIRLDRIDLDTGLADYTHPVSISSSIAITNAPFGRTLGFRHGHSSAFPTPGMTHYRWQFKKEGSTEWTDFAEPLASAVVRYFVDEDETDPSAPPAFPVYPLGPDAIGGKHLYEFRPDEPPQVPGHNRYWPTDTWFGDIYSGILRSQNLPGGVALAAGKYKFRLEIHDKDGNRVAPGPSTFRFIVPTGVDTDGSTILTRDAYDGVLIDGVMRDEIENDGFVFHVHIDNQTCGADIDAPNAGGSVTDPCGFLRYGPGDQVDIGFQATHPDNHAYFDFWMRRGTELVSKVRGEVAAASVTSTHGTAHSYSGDGSGSFEKTDFTTTQLLGTCSEAAFAQILRTRAKATNGWGRLHIYDAGFERAFAIAPETD